jgi:pimeloyl-ACP methyl ester carboxylesterase
MTPSEIAFRHRQVSVGSSSLHVVEAGEAGRPAHLFLHGWPQSWQCWQGVMAEAAAAGAHVVAVDLPGVGDSVGDPTDGSKRALAGVVHELIGALGLERPTLVGHDCGGMVAWAYLRSFDEVRRVVIMDTVVPGLDPWADVLANPYVWHFAFHAIAGLPETLVAGRERAYFDYFFDVLTPDPTRISAEARAASVAAYRRPGALAAGFSWYRSLAADAAANAHDVAPVGVPLLYLRGSEEGGDIERYLAGFRKAGVADVTAAVIAGAGHFTMTEDPAAVWRAIAT